MTQIAVIGRALISHPRVVGSALFSAAVFLVLPGLLPGLLLATTRAVIAWDAGSLALLIATAFLFATSGGDTTMAANAERQDDGAWTIFWITLAGTVASFVAVTVVLANTKDLVAWQRQLHVALVAATLLLSWLVTHVVFALRYAHEYYGRTLGAMKIDAGLEFPGDDAPDYWDFLYFAIVVGMTFQVSDVQITSRKLRRLVIVHGLLSFLFNTVIVALTVNIAASLM